MNIHELDAILALKDWDKICAEIEKRGFRHTDQEGIREFPDHHTCTYSEWAGHVDEAARRKYAGGLFQNHPKYEGVTFISLLLFAKWRDSDEMIPIQFDQYTDAPYDPEYVRASNAPYGCDGCGRVAIKKKLFAGFSGDGRFLCEACLQKDMTEYIEAYEHLVPWDELT